MGKSLVPSLTSNHVMEHNQVFELCEHMRKLVPVLLVAGVSFWPLGASAQTCQGVNQGIARISSEIRSLQAEEVGDNSAPRATMRAARMSFGAQAQANLIEYGRAQGCKFSGLGLPTSITGADSPSVEGSGKRDAL